MLLPWIAHVPAGNSHCLSNVWPHADHDIHQAAHRWCIWHLRYESLLILCCQNLCLWELEV